MAYRHDGETFTHMAPLFYHNTEKYGDREALRYRPAGQQAWRSISWREWGDLCRRLARTLVSDGVGVQQTVGIFSPNRPECIITDFAAQTIRAIPVYIYPTNTAAQAAYIINDAGISVIFAGNRDQYLKAREILPECPQLKLIVVFDGDVDADDEQAVSWNDYLARAPEDETAVRRRLAAAEGGDLIRLIYTSGTTGEPKGVMLTHDNVLFQAAAHDERLQGCGLIEDDVNLCFLPMSHVFEGVWDYYVTIRGLNNCFLEDPAQIVDTIREVRPHVMCAVPRFYEKIYAAAMKQLESASPLKKRLFTWSVNTGRARNNLEKDELPIPWHLELRYRLADALVLKKIRGLIGGRVKFFPAAGAPLAREIEEFFYAVGLYVAYGYGLTETTATTSVHERHGFRFGLVGKPLPGVEVKIDPGSGEILVKGPNIMQGYYHKPEETAAVFTPDGWFKTGDVGCIEDNGELRITDRIKDLMKTSGGKYIAPQLIESLLAANWYIEQVSLIAESRRFVSALIVPAFDAVEDYAREHGISWSSREDLLRHPAVIALIHEQIERESQNLARFEQIKKFVLLSSEFTVDNGELTPTMKVRRSAVEQHYHEQIEELYAE